MEEIQNIWIKYKKSPNKNLKEKLIINYLGLVKYVVNRFEMFLPYDMPGCEADDLISCGVIGLMDAIEKFDIDRGIQFKTYAIARIRGSILDELRALDWTPRSIRKKARELEQAYSKLENKLMRPASDEEIAEILDISIPELHSLLNKVSQSSFLSLDKTCRVKENGQSVQIMEMVEDVKYVNPEEDIENNEKIAALKEVIEKLPEREKYVIALYYFEELNLKEIGKALDVSESRVSQMHTKAILRLKAKLTKQKQEVLV